jgi:predicted TIM-barrel fold metal-dependent hydrolase
VRLKKSGGDMAIDMYAHVVPKRYWEEVNRRIGYSKLEEYVSKEALGIELTRTLWNMDERLRITDKYEGLVQVLVPSGPPLELIAGPKEAADLAKICNDEMAKLVADYGDTFIGAVAFVPLNNVEAALSETDRAITKLGFKGILVHSPIYENDPEVSKPLDMKDLLPLYEKMVEYDLPIWIHPKREFRTADYSIESGSKYLIHQMFGWPYETSVAMARLVYSGVLEKYPTLKLITHHAGGMVPFMAERIINQCEWYKRGLKARFLDILNRPVIEYFRTFFADTAVYGNTSALMCAYAFFGEEHLVFGTDMPYDSELGDKSIGEIMRGITAMDIPESSKRKILEGNARSILKLDD